MMGRALLTVGGIGTLGLVAAALVGFSVGTGGTEDLGLALTRHLMTALLASLLILFSHCWILFYLIGTGKAIRLAAAEHHLGEAPVAASRAFKSRCYPSLAAAVGLVMATFILGGAGFLQRVPLAVHHGLFYLTLLAQVWALVREAAVLADHERLIGELDRRVRASAAAAPGRA